MHALGTRIPPSVCLPTGSRRWTQEDFNSEFPSWSYFLRCPLGYRFYFGVRGKETFHLQRVVSFGREKKLSRNRSSSVGHVWHNQNDRTRMPMFQGGCSLCIRGIILPCECSTGTATYGVATSPHTFVAKQPSHGVRPAGATTEVTSPWPTARAPCKPLGSPLYTARGLGDLSGEPLL